MVPSRSIKNLRKGEGGYTLTSATLICHDCSKTFFLDPESVGSEDWWKKSAALMAWLVFHAGDVLGVEVED